MLQDNKLSGQLIWAESGHTMPNMRLELMAAGMIWIASVKTDAYGFYEFILSPEASKKVDDYISSLSVQIYNGEVLLLAVGIRVTDDTIMVPEAILGYMPDDTHTATDKLPTRLIVQGTVTDSYGQPLVANVNLYETTLERKYFISDVITDENGQYEIKIDLRSIGLNFSSPPTVDYDFSLKVSSYDYMDSPPPGIPFIPDTTRSNIQPSFILEVTDQNGAVIASTNDFFGWEDTITVDIAVAAEKEVHGMAEYVRYKRAVDKVSQLAEADLRTDGESRLDITSPDDEKSVSYVSNAARIDKMAVQNLLKSAEYAGEAGVDAEMLYALIAVKGIQSNPLLAGGQQELQPIIQSAIDRNIITLKSEDDIIAFLAGAKTFQIQATRATIIKGETVTVNDVLEQIFADEGTLVDLLSYHYDWSNDPTDNFWAAYESDRGTSARMLAQRGIQLATIAGMQPEMTDQLMQDTSDGNITVLATLNTTAWETKIIGVNTVHGKQCIPATIIQQSITDGVDAITLYAQKLKSLMQHLYPLATIHAALSAETGDELIADNDTREAVKLFLSNNPSFDARKESIHDLNATDHDLTGIDDVPALKLALEPFQRLLRVTNGHPEAIIAMKAAGVDSAHAIVQLGQENFSASYSSYFGGTAATLQSYNQATYNAAVSDQTAAIIPLSIGTSDISIAPLPQTFPYNPVPGSGVNPDLSTLFGNLDYCGCQQCLSMYSPAAYLTDMLHFLKQFASPAFDELTRRRPDLLHIDLTCKNTNTVVPYIDLVNELLELTIQHDRSIPAALSYQTGGKAEDLAVYPEHTVKQSGGTYAADDNYTFVYNLVLNTGIYPLRLPFNRPLEEVRVYLQHMGVNRADLMQVFTPSHQTDAAAQEYDFEVCCEQMGLSVQEGKIIDNEITNALWEAYGFQASVINGFPDPANSTQTLSGSWMNGIVLARLDILLQQAQITYKELLDILTTRFMNPVGGNGSRNITIATLPGNSANIPADTCDLSKLWLQFADNSDTSRTAFLQKLHRFMRLARTGKRTIHQWDILLHVLSITDLNKSDFIMLGKMMALSSTTGILPEYLASWWGNIDTYQYRDYNQELQPLTPSVYDTIFRSKAMEKLMSASTNTLEAFPDLSSVTGSNPQLNGTYADHLSLIAAAMKIKEEDLQLMTRFFHINEDHVMGLATLSRLFALACIAQATGYSISQLLSAISLFGTAVSFQTIPYTDREEGRKELQGIIDGVGKIKQSHFSVEELAYLLNNDDPTAQLAPDNNSIQFFYEDLTRELSKEAPYTNTPVGITDVPEALLNIIYQHYSKQFGMPIGSIEKLLALPAIAGLVNPDFISHKDTSGQLIPLTEANALLATTNPATTESLAVASIAGLVGMYATYKRLFKIAIINTRLQLSESDFLSLYYNSDKTGFSFDAAVGLLASLQPVFQNSGAILALPANIIQPTSFQQVNVTTVPVVQVITVSTASGPDTSDQPIAQPYSSSGFDNFMRLCLAVQVRNRLGLSEENFGKLLDYVSGNLQSQPAKAQWLSLLQASTTWDEMLPALSGTDTTGGLLNVVVSDIYTADNATAEVKHAALAASCNLILQIADAVVVCRELGVAPETLSAVLTASFPLQAANTIMAAAKAKYDDAGWLAIAKPLRDRLRQRQRDALMAYLLTHPDYALFQNWHSDNDFFAWMLIDTEMQSCMMTSRIKQAINSVQLFIDRVILGLEYKTDGTSISLSTDAQTQWENWRKWYRIWEANRKVFLYPENWLEPELRTDKSVFFEELETELMQDNFTPDRAQDVILNYLTKLDEVARLEPVGSCDQHTTDGAITHAFGRTYDDPHKLFYRRLENNVWTPWEPIDIDIKSEQIVPVFWQNRLYIFWLTFQHKQKTISNGNKLTKQLSHNANQNSPLDYYIVSDHTIYNDLSLVEQSDVQKVDDDKFLSQKMLEVSLNWTEYKSEKWQKHKAGEQKINIGINPFLEGFIAHQEGQVGDTYYKFLLGNGKFNIYDFIQSRIFLKSDLDLDNSLRFRIMHDYTYSQLNYTENARYVNGYSISTPGSQPIVDDGNYSYVGTSVNALSNNVLSPSLTMYQNGKFNCVAISSFRRLYEATNIVTNAASIYTYYNESSVSGYFTQYRGASLAASQILNSNAVNGAYKLTVDNMFYGSPLENKFFFEDTKNTFFVRKLYGNLSLVDSIHNADPSGLTLYNANTYNSAATPTATWGSYFFQTFYHPQIHAFISSINENGIDGLLTLEQQTSTDTMHFSSSYNPSTLVVAGTANQYYPSGNQYYPTNKVDFDYWGAYSSYNWELFFHIPLLIAQRLSSNQQFEAARKWFHYIFDPTEQSTGNGTAVQRFWKFQPFHEKAGFAPQTLNDLLILIHDANQAAQDQVTDWEEDPFQPHVIARMRILSYMKNVVMKYLDNLIAWADQLFSQDTIESINEATQLYILAANILGKEPTEVPTRAVSAPKSYSDISADLDAFGNAAVAIESYIDPNSGTLPSNGNNVPSGNVIPKMFYFCLSKNDKLMSYWDTIADRLFKIRNCRNINGQEQQLSLFDGPIDPSLLMRAEAANIDTNSVLDTTTVPYHYRFSTVLQKANELCADVKGLGNALLSALEKKDAEQLSLLRSGQEISLLEKVRAIKQNAITEAKANIDALEKTRDITEARYEYYNSRPYMNDKEQESMRSFQTATVLQAIQGETSLMAAALNLIPHIHLQAIATGTSTGGLNFGNSQREVSTHIGVLAAITNAKGSMAATMGNYDRRSDDWEFQAQSAQLELDQIDKQLIAAEIRLAMAENDLDNHETQISNARETDDFMRSKFTNQQLYSWMIAQISVTYFQAYQMAYLMAKRAESCYNYELLSEDLSVSHYIKFGYWDSLKQGLLAGEQLQYDLRQLESSYMDNNLRQLELTKHVSLAMLDPQKVLDLRTNGSCNFFLPEALFDMDYPGHYMRRIKSVSVSIPCITGPYTVVNATLTLVKSATRRKNDTDPTSLALDGSGAETIATSSAQNDSGLFELNFRDERYLPFEGRGAVSEWELTLAEETQLRLFDFNSIPDVILHLKYTAKAAKDNSIKTAVIDALNLLVQGNTTVNAQYTNNATWQSMLPDAAETNPLSSSYSVWGHTTYSDPSSSTNGYNSTALMKQELPRYFSLKQEFATEWFNYTRDVMNNVPNPTLNIALNPDQFPFFCKGKNISIGSIYFQQRPKSGPSSCVIDISTNSITSPPGSHINVEVSSIYNVTTNPYPNSRLQSSLSISVPSTLQLLMTSNSTPAAINDLLDDLYLVVYYHLV